MDGEAVSERKALRNWIMHERGLFCLQYIENQGIKAAEDELTFCQVMKESFLRSEIHFSLDCSLY